jgi:hypothetical protein
VRVDQAGQQCTAAAVHDRKARWCGESRADRGDPVVLDEHARPAEHPDPVEHLDFLEQHAMHTRNQTSTAGHEAIVTC